MQRSGQGGDPEGYQQPLEQRPGRPGASVRCKEEAGDAVPLATGTPGRLFPPIGAITAMPAKEEELPPVDEEPFGGPPRL